MSAGYSAVGVLVLDELGALAEGQAKGLSPRWVRRCCESEGRWRKALPHWAQAKGRSPVWVARGSVSRDTFEKHRPHSPQM